MWVLGGGESPAGYQVPVRRTDGRRRALDLGGGINATGSEQADRTCDPITT